MGAMEKVAPELLLHLAHQMQLQTYIYNMIGTCMTATFQFSRHMLRIAAVARLKGPLTAPDDRQLAQPKKGHCCCDRDTLYHLYGG